MIFAESWGFKYKKDDCPFGMSLYPGYQKRRKLLLEKFHGITIKNEKYTEKENLIKLIHSILPGSPILLFCDVFDCPWNISYKRNHINHYILITGIDDVENLYVLDPYSTEDENIISVDSIAPDDGFINYFITLPLDNIQVEDYRSEISISLQHLKNNSFFQNLERFRNVLQIRFEEVIQSEYTDIYAIPLILNLRRIAHQRNCYCIFLNKMVEKNIVDSSMVRIMENIAEKYSRLRILLIRQIMKKKNNKECFSIINEILDNEYEAYEKMKSFI